jgi:hypothetical protein
VNRRRFLAVTLGATASVALVRFSVSPGQAAPSVPGHAHGDRDMLRAAGGGKVETHLLPFAPVFANERAARAACADARALRVIG